MASDYFTCRCPEPDAPDWAHLVPIDCAPLNDGETVEEWRKRRYGYWDDVFPEAVEQAVSQ